jgi:hypothetical protein
VVEKAGAETSEVQRQRGEDKMVKKRTAKGFRAGSEISVRKTHLTPSGIAQSTGVLPCCHCRRRSVVAHHVHVVKIRCGSSVLSRLGLRRLEGSGRALGNENKD